MSGHSSNANVLQESRFKKEQKIEAEVQISIQKSWMPAHLVPVLADKVGFVQGNGQLAAHRRCISCILLHCTAHQ